MLGLPLAFPFMRSSRAASVVGCTAARRVTRVRAPFYLISYDMPCNMMHWLDLVTNISSISSVGDPADREFMAMTIRVCACV